MKARIGINRRVRICQEAVLRIPDPGSGAFLSPGSGMGKKSGSGMNNPIIIPRVWKQFFGVKILKFYNEDLGSGMGRIRICPEVAQQTKAYR
jgi:hypothetical protein